MIKFPQARNYFSTYRSTGALALAGAWYAHGLPIFGNRATRNLNALAAQFFGDCLIRYRFACVFRVDEVVQPGLDRRSRCAAVVFGGDAIGKKMLEFERSPRRQKIGGR